MLHDYMMNLGDDVQKKELKHYYAYKRIQNFACVEIHPKNGSILLYLKVDPGTVDLKEGFTRDVTGIGHYGTGNLEIRIRTDEEFEQAKMLIERSYEVN